ncbi:MAG: putative tricarboxylic transport membrane protein [Kiritimatiellia bacterium]|jgi:putative tricarboxylic transport membrane protein
MMGVFNDPVVFALMALGVSLGITVGAIPGLTGAMLIALTLPLTYHLESGHAMVLLVSMYVGSVSGGLITATLLRMPGTPASIMTTLDGYPLAKSGRPGRALGLGISASLVGGLISWLFLWQLSEPFARWSTKFGPFEFFSLVFMALLLIASVSQGSLWKGLFAGLLGMLISMPGMHPATGQIRLTFGIDALSDGFKLLPVLIGLFALSQILQDLLHLEDRAEKITGDHKGLFLKWADWKKQAVNLIRSSLIGTGVGILPGVGANIGSVMAYSATKNLSREPETFGTGAEAGIVASEAANNATVGGALIPLIALGIPGSVIDAILLGAFVIHGLTPGPLLFTNNPEIVHTIMGAYLVANLFMAVFMWLSVRWITRLTDIPRYVLLPVVLVFCVIGSFALSSRMFDVWVMLGFGLVGFVMERAKIPLAPFVIGFVLAPVAEENLCSGLMQSGGSWLPLVTRPMSLVFLLMGVGLVLFGLKPVAIRNLFRPRGIRK